MGEKAVYVERDCGVDCDSLNRLDALVRETSKCRRENENGDPRESNDKLYGSVPEMVKEGGRGSRMVGLKTESEEHGKEAEGFGAGEGVGSPVLQMRGDGEREGKERKEVEKVWWGRNEKSEK